MYRPGDRREGRRTEQHFPWGRCLLEPGGDVDGVAGCELLVAGATTPDDDLARVDAGADGDPDAVVTLELGVQNPERLTDLGSGADGAQRIVLMHPGDAEDGHDGVADELLDRPAVPLEHALHRLEIAPHHATQALRIEPLAEGRRSGDIGEEHGDDLACLRLESRQGKVGAAGDAEARIRRVLARSSGRSWRRAYATQLRKTRWRANRCALVQQQPRRLHPERCGDPRGLLDEAGITPRLLTSTATERFDLVFGETPNDPWYVRTNLQILVKDAHGRPETGPKRRFDSRGRGEGGWRHPTRAVGGQAGPAGHDASARTVSVPPCLREAHFAAVCCGTETDHLQPDSRVLQSAAAYAAGLLIPRSLVRAQHGPYQISCKWHYFICAWSQDPPRQGPIWRYRTLARPPNPGRTNMSRDLATSRTPLSATELGNWTIHAIRNRDLDRSGSGPHPHIIFTGEGRELGSVSEVFASLTGGVV